MNRIARSLYNLLRSHRVILVCWHRPGIFNEKADRLSRDFGIQSALLVNSNDVLEAERILLSEIYNFESSLGHLSPNQLQTTRSLRRLHDTYSTEILTKNYPGGSEPNNIQQSLERYDYLSTPDCMWREILVHQLPSICGLRFTAAQSLFIRVALRYLASGSLEKTFTNCAEKSAVEASTAISNKADSRADEGISEQGFSRPSIDQRPYKNSADNRFQFCAEKRFVEGGDVTRFDEEGRSLGASCPPIKDGLPGGPIDMEGNDFFDVFRFSQFSGDHQEPPASTDLYLQEREVQRFAPESTAQTLQSSQFTNGPSFLYLSPGEAIGQRADATGSVGFGEDSSAIRECSASQHLV